MGPPKFGWKDIPLAEEFRDTRSIELQNRPDRRAGAAYAVGGQHGQSACDLLGSMTSAPTILPASGRLLENHPIFPERANITLAHIVDRDHITIRTWERGAGRPGPAVRRPAPPRWPPQAEAHQSHRARFRCPVASSPSNGASAIDHMLMTGTATFEYEGRFDPALFASVA